MQLTGKARKEVGLNGLQIAMHNVPSLETQVYLVAALQDPRCPADSWQR